MLNIYDIFKFVFLILPCITFDVFKILLGIFVFPKLFVSNETVFERFIIKLNFEYILGFVFCIFSIVCLSKKYKF